MSCPVMACGRWRRSTVSSPSLPMPPARLRALAVCQSALPIPRHSARWPAGCRSSLDRGPDAWRPAVCLLNAWQFALYLVNVWPVSATISVRNLRKSYGSKVAVDTVSFEVEQGEFFGILGPNGAGKTTTLEILEGLRKPDGGELSVLGLPPWPRNAALLPRIGVQLQASSFFERLTAREQIRTFASLYHVPTRRADHMLSLVGLDDQAGVKAEKLSGGQAQRLSIACALVHDPELVFMDEPTGALDPQARRNLWDLLRKINADGRTVVLTTHHMDEAETLCDRVAIMDHGKILELGPPAALVRGLDTPTRISIQSGLLDAVTAGQLAASADSLPADSVSGSGSSDIGVSDDGVSLTFATRDPAVILADLAGRNAVAGLRVQGATLEDVFLQLTGREYRA